MPAHLDRTKYRYCCCSARSLARSTQTQLVRRVLTTRLMPLAARSAPHWASPDAADAPVVGPLLGGRGDSQTHALNAGSMLPARPLAPDNPAAPAARIQPEEGTGRTPTLSRPCPLRKFCSQYPRFFQKFEKYFKVQGPEKWFANIGGIIQPQNWMRRRAFSAWGI